MSFQAETRGSLWSKAKTALTNFWFSHILSNDPMIPYYQNDQDGITFFDIILFFFIKMVKEHRIWGIPYMWFDQKSQ